MAATEWTDFNDPRFKEWLRGQLYGDTGVSIDDALRYSGVYRPVDLITGSMAMIPARVVDEASGNAMALDQHPVTRLLGLQPNPWMTAHRFKRIMQFNLLTQPKGALARVIWSGNRPAGLIPLAPVEIRIEQEHYHQTRYFLNGARSGEQEIDAREILHLRDMELPDARGGSRVQQAGDAIRLALAASSAAESVFRNGLKAGGALTHPKQLSEQAKARLRTMMEGAKGAANAGRWFVLEEGLTAVPFEVKAADQQVEQMRRLQIEEAARFFGVPRPLMMVDETAWGSGIEQLAHLFVRFCLNYWFSCWEDACAVTLLSLEERRRGLRVDFDESELLRGTMKDLAAFLSKALGAGGQASFGTANEARAYVGWPKVEGGDVLYPPSSHAQQTEPPEDQTEKST